MMLSEQIHEGLSSRMLSKHHRVRTVQLKRWQAEATELESTNAALLEALEMLVYANKKRGTCACGYDGKLTGDLCPIHGVGACKANEAIRKAKEK